MSNMNKKFITFGIILTFGLLVGALGVLWQKPGSVFGSIETGQGYFSTSTDSTWASATAVKTLKLGYGQIGSIIVASSSAGVLSPYSLACYDSSVSTSTASSTIIVIGGTAVAGTYQLDRTFSAGLKCDAPAGFAGNYTITFK